MPTGTPQPSGSAAGIPAVIRPRELAADPFTVDPARLADTATVAGTWVGGERVDLSAFLAGVGDIDTAPHAHLAGRAGQTGCC